MYTLQYVYLMLLYFIIFQREKLYFILYYIYFDIKITF